MFVMKFNGTCKNFTDYTYKEQINVKNGYVVVQHEETRDVLLVTGYTDITGTPEAEKVSKP